MVLLLKLALEKSVASEKAGVIHLNYIFSQYNG